MDRFPALAIRLHHALGLPADAAAFDLSLACSGYPYGLLAAAQLATATGKRVLLVDGDVQSAHVDVSDANTLAVMSDAATATLLAPGGDYAPLILRLADDPALCRRLAEAAARDIPVYSWAEIAEQFERFFESL